MPSALQRFSVRPVDPQREERERHRDRQHQHDDDRLDEALELRREHHVDEDHRQRDRHDQVRRRLVENLRLAPAAGTTCPAACSAPVKHRADVVRRLVERVAGRDVGDQLHGELPVRRAAASLGPRPRSMRAMLSMRTGPFADGTVSRPISAMSRALVLEHADLHRILLRPFLVEARSRRRRRPPAAACCRSSPSGRRGRRRACRSTAT